MTLGAPLFVTGTYTVTRQATGAYVAGVWVPGSGSTFTLDAGVQPINGADLRLLPEGQHVEELRKLYTATQLFTARDNKAPDTIAIDSESWRVIQVRKYSIRGTYYRAIVARIPTP